VRGFSNTATKTDPGRTARSGSANASVLSQRARQDAKGKQLLREARRVQVDNRDLAGYRDLVAGYLAHLADTDPHASPRASAVVALRPAS
jgi:hypothetical protein